MESHVNETTHNVIVIKSKKKSESSENHQWNLHNNNASFLQAETTAPNVKSGVHDELKAPKYSIVQQELNEWEIITKYASEYMEYNFDIPDLTIQQQFFNFFIKQNKIQMDLEDIKISHQVIRSKVPNRFGCRIPVKSGWNINILQRMLHGYDDMDVVEWLK